MGAGTATAGYLLVSSFSQKIPVVKQGSKWSICNDASITFSESGKCSSQTHNSQQKETSPRKVHCAFGIAKDYCNGSQCVLLSFYNDSSVNIAKSISLRNGFKSLTHILSLHTEEL